MTGLERVNPGLVGIAALLTLSTTGCSSLTDASGGVSDPDAITCDALADEATTIDSGRGPSLLKVRNPRVVQDNTDSYEVPTGNGEALVLSCEGAGVWSDSSKGDVTLKLTVDSDEEVFISYREQ